MRASGGIPLTLISGEGPSGGREHRQSHSCWGQQDTGKLPATLLSDATQSRGTQPKLMSLMGCSLHSAGMRGSWSPPTSHMGAPNQVPGSRL